MRKGYVMPNEEFINDLDLELTCLQVYILYFFFYFFIIILFFIPFILFF